MKKQRVLAPAGGSWELDKDGRLKQVAVEPDPKPAAKPVKKGDN